MGIAGDANAARPPHAGGAILRVAARADLGRLLAACFYEPGPEFAEERLFDALCAAAANVDGECLARATRMGAMFGATDPTDLLVDYTRLFLGPVATRARPYGSVWMGEGAKVMEDSTMDVLALYAEGGFEMDERFRDLPDHVAAELEFLYLTLFREAQGVRDGNHTTVASWRRLRARFLSRHLATWIGPFADAVATGAETDFYRELAELARRFVRAEARLVMDASAS